MYDRNVYWPVLASTAVLLAVAALCMEMSGIWFLRYLRPDPLWCLAFFAAWRTPSIQLLVTFFGCGVLRDIVLGPSLGAAALAYLISAVVVAQLRDFAVGAGFTEHLVLAGTTAIAATLGKALFDSGWTFFENWTGLSVLAFGNGLFTLLIYPLTVLVFSVPLLKPWRERRWSF